MRRYMLLVAVASVPACVFPASEPTGVEFTWRFMEANAVDGEESMRVRSCEGAKIEVIAMDITDDDVAPRQGIFRFPCAEGYQTLAQFQTEASKAFVELQPGMYTVQGLAIDPGAFFGDAEFIEQRPIEISDRQVATQVWEIARPPAPLTVTLQGASECAELGLALYYDDPAAQLPDTALEDEQNGSLLYRNALVSEGDALRLDGVPFPCGPELDGVHVVPDVDRGDYLLEVSVDGAACALRVTVGAEGAAVPLDLARLPCGG